MKEIENLMNGDSLIDILDAMYKIFKTFKENEFKKGNKCNIEIYIDLNKLTRDKQKLLIIDHILIIPLSIILKKESTEV